MDGVYVGDGAGGGGGSSDGKGWETYLECLLWIWIFLSDWWLERGLLGERHL